MWYTNGGSIFQLNYSLNEFETRVEHASPLLLSSSKICFCSGSVMFYHHFATFVLFFKDLFSLSIRLAVPALQSPKILIYPIKEILQKSTPGVLNPLPPPMF